MQAEELLKLAKKEKLDQLEPAWMAAIAEGSCDLEALLEIPELLVARGRGELAETLLWYLVDSLTERGEKARALQAACRGARFLPRSSVVRDLLADLYGDVRSDRSDMGDLVRLTLKVAEVPLDQALDALEKLMALRPGTYVMDRQQGAVGRVVGLDAEQGGLVVALAEGAKVYTAALVGRLEPVEADDFRALCVFERERVEALARDDPEELVRILLSTLDRRMELRRLRLYLEPVVGSWGRWWSAAREALKRSAVIGMTEGGSPSVFLRAKLLSHEERLLRRFDALEGPGPKLAMALEILREADEQATLSAQSLQHVADQVKDVGRSAAAAGQAAVALAAASVADAMAEQTAGPAVEEASYAGYLRALLSDPGALVAGLSGASKEVLLCAMDYVRRQAPGVWQAFFAAVMPFAGRDACEAIARRLEAAGAGEALAEARREILAGLSRACGTGALSWLWRDCAGGAGAEGTAGVDGAVVAMQLFVALAATVRAQDLSEEERKDRIAELRGALFLREGAPLRAVLEKARPEQVTVVKAFADRGAGLTPHMQADLTKILRAVRPALYEKAVPPWEQGITYTTEAGIERRKADLEHLVYVRLPEVMREVGQAASFGDVSDNAEYGAAVAERARLAERAGRIQEELSEARFITREMASADHVTVGSRVRTRNLKNGETEVLTFLGPWDARPDERVYAYNAPLGLAFMGKRVGETVTFVADTEERRWEILGVEPAL